MIRILKIVYLENALDQLNDVRQALSCAQISPDIHCVNSQEDLLSYISESAPDLILSEYISPGQACGAALQTLRELHFTIPFIAICNSASADMSAEMLRLGVDDFILTSEMSRLPFAVHKALETYNVKQEQQALLQHLSDREKHFRTLVENSTDAVVILDQEGQPTYVSLAVKNVLGYTAEEVLSMDIFTKAHPDDLPGLFETMQIVHANPGKAIPGHTGRMLHKDGTWRWIEATVINLLHDPAIRGIVDNFRDVTKQKVGEEKILHLNRLYAFLSQVNRTLVHAPDAQTVLREVCRIACETGQFEAAWIGMFPGDSGETEVLEQQNMTADSVSGFANALEEQQLVREILSTQPHYVSNETRADFISARWKGLAALVGYESCMILPIRKSGEIVGTFNLYGAHTEIFTDAEIKLLDEAAMGISFALDVFEKEKLKLISDEQLRHKERRLSQAQAIAHLGSWETDLALNRSVWSDEACKIFGLSEDDNIQSTESWLSFVHPDDLEYVVRNNQLVLDTMQPNDYHHRIIRRDGAIRYLHVQTHVELNAAGQPASLYGVLHDVTAQKLAEEKVIRTLEERNVILESIGDGFYALDKNWVVTYWNKEAEAMLTRPKETVLGKNIWVVFPDVMYTDIYHSYERAIETNVIQHFEFFYETTNAWFEVTAYPSSNGLSVYFRNITERKASEAQLRELNENLRNYASELTESNKGLDQFAYIVSHNLRAPVANIIGLGELLSQDDYPSDLREKFLEGIIVNVKRLDDVISDLNAILQVKQGLSENKERVNLQNLVDNIRSSLLNIMEKEQVSIVTDFRDSKELFTLKTYIYSIFYNLIINSIKYRRPDRPPVIHISSRVEEGKLSICFRDNGMGIDLGRKGAQVFGLYKRFHNHVEGKGLGLFMVKTQVEMLGGKIYISSTVNEGTEMRVEFCADLCYDPVV